MNRAFFPLIWLLTLTIWAWPLKAQAQEKLLLAVASNFSGPMDALLRGFKEETGMEAEAVYSSTGKLFAQIQNGAPYDLFFAADNERPGILSKEGLCDLPFVYAEGEVVLWIKNIAPGKATWDEALAATGGKVAIASPETAPYGAAALQAIKRKGLLPALQNRLVYAQNVGQAFQYGFEGAAGSSFTALSYALSPEGKQGHYWPVPEAPRIEQQACALKRTTRPEAVRAFLEFFRTSRATGIVQSYGYR